MSELSESILTKEQQEKLAKLEAELESKRKYEESSRERRLAASKRTGIPYDIVDTDVVRIGSMFGLIRALDKRESNEKDSDDVSILDLLLGIGEKTPSYSYSNIPPYFVVSSYRIKEEDRAEQHREFVKNKCSSYWDFVSEFLTTEHAQVEKVISLSLQQLTPDSFVNTVKENMDVILEIVQDDPAGYLTDTTLQDQLKILRNSLLSVIPICEYKNLLIEQVKRLPQKNLDSLSYVDAALILFPGFESLQQQNIIGILRSLVVRSHTKDPKLAPLNMSLVVKECCTPALMFVHLREVLRHTIIGPYANNPIGIMSKNFYILKCISENVRMWVRDDGLIIFSHNLRNLMLAYVTKTLNTVRSASKSVSTVETQLIDTLNALKKPNGFRKLICSIVSSHSPIIPTEADVFDFIPENEVMIYDNIR